MTEPEIRICAKCRWCNAKMNGDFMCMNPLNGIDLVTGMVAEMRCRDHRADRSFVDEEKYCGVVGAWFEEVDGRRAEESDE